MKRANSSNRLTLCKRCFVWKIEIHVQFEIKTVRSIAQSVRSIADWEIYKAYIVHLSENREIRTFIYQIYLEVLNIYIRIDAFSSYFWPKIVRWSHFRWKSCGDIIRLSDTMRVANCFPEIGRSFSRNTVYVEMSNILVLRFCYPFSGSLILE